MVKAVRIKEKCEVIDVGSALASPWKENLPCSFRKVLIENLPKLIESCQ